jgi:hypothetical protein
MTLQKDSITQRMIIDNFSKIEKYITFPSSNHFYFIQILRRRKDDGNNSQNVDVKVIRSFYIYSLDEFNKAKQDIIDTCNFFNARAYIWLNPRNCKDIALFTIQELARYIQSNNLVRLHRIWNHCTGKLPASGKKYWIVDVDTKDEKEVKDIMSSVNVCQSEFAPIIIDKLTTKNGYHLITHPFNCDQFRALLFTYDVKFAEVKKDSPTLLYFNESTCNS